MSIKSTKYGTVHAYAQCGNCSWDSGINIEEVNRLSKLRYRIFLHIKKTGHYVNLETGQSTTYSHE